MASIYDKFAIATGKMLSGPLGGTAILRRISGGGYDDNGDVVPLTTSDVRVSAVVKDQDVWNKGAFLGRKTVATVISKIKPTPQDQLLFGTETYSITTVSTVAPDGKAVIKYELVVT
jgi:hypothetical protein